MAYSEEINTYIDGLEAEKQERMHQIRSLIHELVPTVEEKIKWRMPAFILPGKGDIVYVAAFKKHIGFYPLPEAIDLFGEELKDYPTSKGAIRLPLDKPLPMDLIKRIVLFRLELVKAK